MQKNTIYKTEYAEVAFAYARGEEKRYTLNIILKENGDTYDCLSHTYNHYPIEEDKEKLYADYLALVKRMKIAKVVVYDTSENVNSFYLAGQSAWLAKADRVGLVNSIAIEKAAGKTETTLYLNGVALTIGIEQAQQMLSALELYALDCYRKTEEHKMTINALSVIEEVESYDITLGYPEKLYFEI